LSENRTKAQQNMRNSLGTASLSTSEVISPKLLYISRYFRLTWRWWCYKQHARKVRNTFNSLSETIQRIKRSQDFISPEQKEEVIKAIGEDLSERAQVWSARRTVSVQFCKVFEDLLNEYEGLSKSWLLYEQFEVRRIITDCRKLVMTGELFDMDEEFSKTRAELARRFWGK